jgi:outer membrane protein TolC
LIRRRQSDLGVIAAVTAVGQAEREAVYAVKRSYFSVVYARAQENIARGVVERLSSMHEAAQKALEAGARNAKSDDVHRTAVYWHLAETKLSQASQGVPRAVSALREATGLGPHFALDITASSLPEPTARPNLDFIVREALTRRSELVQAQLFAEAACLETNAQAAGHFKRKMETFAAGTDIHVDLVPAEAHNGEYRPGAVPPEMPTLLAGTAGDRALHADSLVKRAEIVIQAARNLITLEAEDAFLRWQEAFDQARKAKLAADEGETLARDLDKDFTSGLNARIDEVVTAQVLSSQARSAYIEFLYKQILALADLERVTAGGFNAELVGMPSGFVPAPAPGLQGPPQSPKAGSVSTTFSLSPVGTRPPFHP